MADQIDREHRRRRSKRARSPRSWGPKRIALFALLAAGGIALILVVLASGPKIVNGWREARWIKRAQTRLDHGDFVRAATDAQQALTFDRNSVPAFKVLAEATEKQNSPDTVAWRAQIARAQPNAESQLNLASAALRFGQLDLARRALDSVPKADRASAAFNVVAGWLDRAQGNEAGVERHFAAAVAKEPGNELYQFNLAALQIKSADKEKAATARETLERLAGSAPHRAGALRALLNDAIKRSDPAAADRYAEQLQMSPEVTFSDYLLCLDFYKKLDGKKISILLQRVKPVAARNPNDLALLLGWMNRNGMSAEVTRWIEKLPSEIATNPPPSVEVAEAFAEQQNWSRLRRWTRSGSWGDYEYLRLAYQAFGARQTRQSAADAEFESLWHAAERACADNSEREIRLARLATRWKLTSEAEQLWLHVAHNPLTRREALDALSQIYRSSNDLANLYLTAMRLHETSPNEPAVAAEFARLSLILERNINDGERVAKEAYDAAPTDVRCVVAEALALYSQGRTGEGIALLRGLPPETQHEPHVAVYLAVLLLDDAKIAAAQEFIKDAKDDALYVEERRLLEDAERKSQNASPAVSATPATPSPSPVKP